ncbi:MAG: lipopolysaccharide heptosyltransferase II [Nitrospiraceae bacterium]|nr:lipopolysaccharide heptosyltransferase II [Nitrospiraceae bacterium]
MTQSPPKRILALVPNWIGDVAMCTPALRALHQRFPDAGLAVAGRASACALLRGLPWLSEFVAIPARPGIVETLRVARRLRPHARDLTVAFPHAFRAALLARLAGSAQRLGYDRDGRGLLLTRRVPPHRVDGKIQPVYMADEYLTLVEAIGCENDGKGLELRTDPDVAREVEAHMSGSGPCVGIAPGAAFGPAKRWPAERFAAVADQLTERAGAQCVLLTGPGEEETRDAVLAAARHPLISPDGGQPTIDTMKAAIAALDLLVGNDSGARHVAIAFDVPVICIMGPTRPAYSVGPYERGRLLRLDVDCGPCQKPVCETDHRCMLGITVDAVTEAALEWL